VNIHETNGRSVTEALPGLLMRRNRVGAESKEGRLLSNLIQQIRNYQREEDPVARANLERFMGWSIIAIQRAA
jgi:hypothetical protein